MSLISSEITTENYLKEIVKYFLNSSEEIISTKKIAKQLNVTHGTATYMVQKLENKGFLKYEKHVGCILTQTGRIYGLDILRRHRLLETFLHQTLNMTSDEIHSEAENLEHAVSDKLVDKIDEFLNHPKRDPHGAAIPQKNQSEYVKTDIPVSALEQNIPAKIVRLNGNSRQLAYYNTLGIHIGAVIQVLNKNPDTGFASITVNNSRIECALIILENILAEI